MNKYLVRCSVPYTVLDAFQKALENTAESIIVFEDLESLPSDALDENDFPIASLFQVDLLCNEENVAACKAQAEAAAALLGLSLEVRVEKVEDTDWLLACHQGQPEIHVAPFVIHSSYNPYDAEPGEIPVKIDAATAFGSGEHPTTYGCLQLFVSLCKTQQFQTILDMGCGSGVLSICAKKLLPHLVVTAVDIEMEAVQRTQLNTTLNDCTDNYTAICSVGFENAKTHGSYDLCFANILANPLILLAPDMQQFIKPGGYVIASGLLDKQAPMVIEAYQSNGFAVDSTVSIEGWQSIVFKKG